MSTAQTNNRVWYDANCHCRRVSLRFRSNPLYFPEDSPGDAFRVWNCNCSICTKNGYLNVYPNDPKEDIEWSRGKDDLKSYEYGSHVKHMFCPTCGSSIVLYVDWGQGEKTGVNVSYGQTPQII